MKKVFCCVFTFLFSFTILISPLAAYADTPVEPFVDVPAFQTMVDYVNQNTTGAADGTCAFLFREFDGTNYKYKFFYGRRNLNQSTVIKVYYWSPNGLWFNAYQNYRVAMWTWDPASGSSTWTENFNRTNVVGDQEISSVNAPADNIEILWSLYDLDIYRGSTVETTFLTANNIYDPVSGEYLGASSGEDEEQGNGGYNDSSFKTLISDLFQHLFDVLLYGEDEDYDSSEIDDSIQWLEDLSDDMEDITDKLNQAPTYISNGFTALTNAQTAINDFFSGVSSAIPVIYYGIVGILDIIIIRKIIGR